jgi:hypothetical protein
MTIRGLKGVAIAAAAVLVAIGIVLALSGGARAQEGMTLTLEPAEAQPGGWTVVTVNVTSPEPVGAAHYEVVFDPIALRVLECGSRFGPCNPEAGDDRAAFAIFSTQGLGDDAGTVTFAVREAAPPGETLIDIEVRECVDLEGNPATCTAAGAALTVDESAPAQGAPPAVELTPDWTDEGLGPEDTMVENDLIVNEQQLGAEQTRRLAENGDGGGTNLTPWLLGALAVALVAGAAWAAVWARRRA